MLCYRYQENNRTAAYQVLAIVCAVKAVWVEQIAAPAQGATF